MTFTRSKVIALPLDHQRLEQELEELQALEQQPLVRPRLRRGGRLGVVSEVGVVVRG